MAGSKHKLLERQDWDLVRKLVDECLDLPESERRAHLAEATEGMPGIRKEVESLLGAASHEEQFLEAPIVESLVSLADENGSADAAANAAPVTKYRFVRQLGMGGMAEVFLARMMGPGGFEKRVAIKRLLPVYSDDETFAQLFENEARLSSLLAHANIVQVFDYLKAEGCHMLAMEYVEGMNLAQITRRIDGKKLPTACLLHVINEVAKGLDYAHARCDDRTGEPLHIVHRDVSPKNLMVSFDGNVKIVDFGIANAKDRARITQSGSLRGTIQYMSPEQTRGEPLDGRSDVFALGLVFYEAVAGEPIFAADSALGLIRRIQECKGVEAKVAALSLPDELKRVLVRALEREPDRRYRTAGELHQDLQRFMNAHFTTDPSYQMKTFMRRVFADDIVKVQAANAAEPKESLTVMAPSGVVMARSGLVSGMPRGATASKKLQWLLGMSLAFAATVVIVKLSLSEVFNPPRVESLQGEAGRGPAGAMGDHDCQARVESVPPGARVSVNGLFLGVTPTTIDAPCLQAVELELEQAGYEKIAHNIRVREKSARMVLTLMPKAVPLTPPEIGK